MISILSFKFLFKLQFCQNQHHQHSCNHRCPNLQVLVPIIPNDECITWHEDKNIMVQVKCTTCQNFNILLPVFIGCCQGFVSVNCQSVGDWVVGGFVSRQLLSMWGLVERKRELISAQIKVRWDLTPPGSRPLHHRLLQMTMEALGSWHLPVSSAN